MNTASQLRNPTAKSSSTPSSSAPITFEPCESRTMMAVDYFSPSVDGSARAEIPMDQISLNYSKIVWSYSPTKAY